MTLELTQTWQEAKLNAHKQLQNEKEAKRVEKEENVLEVLSEEKQNHIISNRADGRVRYIGSEQSFVECAMRGEFEKIVEFIRNGDDLNAAHEYFGYSPLHAAAEFGHLNTVRALLNAGADPNVRERRETKRTPLHLAAACGRVDIILELIRAKADKNQTDALEKLPLNYAELYGKTEAMKALWDPPSKPSAVAIRYAIHYEVSHQILTFCKVPHDGGSPLDRYEFAISRCDDAQGTIERCEFEPWIVRSVGVTNSKDEDFKSEKYNNDSMEKITAKQAAQKAAYVAAVAAKYSNCYDCAVRKWMSRLSEGVEVDPDCADGHGILEQSDPTWRHVTWHDIKPYTRYRFKARAHNLLGWSEWSDIVERRTKVAIPDIPGAPFSIATTPTCIVLSWKEPSGNGLPVLDYLIHWSREGVGRVWTGWRRFRIVPGAHVRIESLASDRGYKFRVNARNEMGSSNFSESSAVIVTYQAIDIVDIKSTSIEISWKNLGYCSSPDVDRFEMQVMDCLHKKWITTSDELRGTCARASKLQPNRLYLLRIRPHFKESGWKDWSDCVATEPVRTLSSSPSPPDVLEFDDIQHDSVLFSWDAGEENGSAIEKYRIRMKKREEEEWRLVSDQIVSFRQNHVLKDLESSCEFEVQISALNKHGWGPNSKIARVRTMAVPRPSQPRLTMRRLDSVMKVSWNPPESVPSHIKIERYELQIRRHDQDVTVWTVLNDKIPGDRNSEMIDDLESARQYVFRVRVFTSIGQSQFSLPSELLVTRRAL